MICDFVEKLLKNANRMWLWVIAVLVAFLLIGLGVLAFFDWLLA